MAMGSRAANVVLRSALMLGGAVIAYPAIAQAPGSAAVQPDAGAQSRLETQAAPPAGPAVQAGAATDTQTSGVEDIIVTAQKREQNLQSVPISITALSETAIKANRIQDVRDLNAVAPNLTVRLGGGGNLSPNYTLRGILAAATAAGADKGVALYVDGVYFGVTSGSVFDFADIERIEVLKGPQGTLFGRNATGGAISIITRNPSGEFGGRQELTYGNYDQFRSKTRIDTPKIGPFSATVTYLHSERRGDVRNSGAGTVWDYATASNGRYGMLKSPKYLGDNNTEAVAATLKADLFEGLDLIYKFDYSKTDYTPNAQGLSFLTAPSTVLGQLYAGSPNAKTPITRKRPDAVNNEFTTPARNKVYGHNLTAQYQLTDEISFKNILSYRKTDLYTNFQLDGLGGLRTQNVTGLGPNPIPVGALNGNPGLQVFTPGVPFLALGNNALVKDKQWSEEFQVNITTDWFNVTAGYLHFDNTSTQQGPSGLYNTSVLQPINGQFTSRAGTPFVIPAAPGYRSTTVKVKSDAFFIQPEIHITDKLDLVAGARITKDKKDGVEFAPDQVIPRVPTAAQATTVQRIIAANTVAAGLFAGTIPSISAPIRYRDSQASFLLGVNYRFSDRILGYAKYATGYISGGQLATIPFQPEKAKSYEVGLKTDLFDRRLRSNLAVFYADYSNTQTVTSGIITGVPSSALYSTAIVSAADARAYGFEWENTIVPVDGLTLTASVGYTDFKYDQDTLFGGVNPDGSICRGRTACSGGFVLQSGIPGYKEFQRPKWTGTLAAQYDSPELFRRGHLVARLDGNFRSRMLMTSDIALGSAVNAPETPAVRVAASTPFQWIVNGRLGITNVDLGRTKAEVALWTRNMFNNRNITQYVGVDFGVLGAFGSVIYERARTFGIDVSLGF